MHEVQSVIWCINRSILLNITYKAIYKFYFEVFLFINYLTKHHKISNMHFKSLNMLSDFM
jgi:hypothetical protein